MPDTPNVIVELYQGRWRLPGRPQKWRFRAIGGNGEKMSSSEGYVNREDARHALQVLFGDRSHVILRDDPDHGHDTVLRYPKAD